MKIVCVDNFGRGGEVSGKDDRLIAEGLTEEDAHSLANQLNYGTDGSRRPKMWFYEVKPESYVLQRFAP